MQGMGEREFAKTAAGFGDVIMVPVAAGRWLGSLWEIAI